MRAKIRSATGALLMLLLIPFIVGLLACMPVPIGNPERSRIDPSIDGIWILIDTNESLGFYAFEPYDKRTWLLAGMTLDGGADADFSGYDLDSYAGLAELMASESVGDDGVVPGKIELYKAWRTRLGGEWFMTWEPKGVYDNDAFEPEVWFVFRVERPDPDTLELYMVHDENDFFDDVEESRRAYERVLKKHARDPDLYADEPVRLLRLRPEHRSFFEDLAGNVISFH